MGVIPRSLAARAMSEEIGKQDMEHLMENHASAEDFRGKPRHPGWRIQNNGHRWIGLGSRR